MSPEELERLENIEWLLLEIKRKFDSFTTEKKQHWEEEKRRWRERVM
jgi:hypothetical protein